MQVDTISYIEHQYMKEAKYLHRFYFPKEFRDVLQPQDLAVIYGEAVAMKKTYDQTARNIRHYFTKEPFTIRYIREGLVKEIPETLMNIAVRECLRYFREVHDEYSLSREQVYGLIDLGWILSRLEGQIQREVEDVCREMQERREREEIEELEREKEMRQRKHALENSDNADDFSDWIDIPTFPRLNRETSSLPFGGVLLTNEQKKSAPDFGLSSGETTSDELPPKEAPPETTVEIVVTYGLSNKNARYIEGDQNIVHRYSESVTIHPGFDFETLQKKWETEIKRGHKKTGTYSYFNKNRGWLYSELVHFSEVPVEHICSVSNIKVEINKSYSFNKHVVSTEECTYEVLSFPHYRPEELFWQLE